MILRFFIENLDKCFIDSMLRMCFFVKTITISFFDRLTRRENTVLSK